MAFACFDAHQASSTNSAACTANFTNGFQFFMGTLFLSEGEERLGRLVLDGVEAVDGASVVAPGDWQTNNMALNQVFGKKSLRTSGFS